MERRLRSRWLSAITSLALAFALPACIAGQPRGTDDVTSSTSGPAVVDSRFPPTTGMASSDFAALWPEHTLRAAREAQNRVGARRGELTWRLDPAATAKRFAIHALAWGHPTVGRVQTWTVLSGIEMARVWLCTEADCPTVGPVFDEEIILQRLVRPGPDGIWSVTEVNSGLVQLAGFLFLKVSGIEVAAGHTVGVFTLGPGARGLPEGTVLEAGSVSWGSCGTVPEWGPATLRLRETTFEAATLGCGKDGTIAERVPGYVFAMRPASTAGEHDFLSTIFDPEPGVPPAPVQDLTAVAVHFVPPGPA